MYRLGTVKIFYMKFITFTIQLQKSLYIAWACFHNISKHYDHVISFRISLAEDTEFSKKVVEKTARIIGTEVGKLQKK